MEIHMKKLLITVATISALSTASFAQSARTDNDKKMRHQFMEMTEQMVNSQMEMLKIHSAMLTNYQRLLKQMMENETSDN
jgi:hypothetical protein